MVDRYTKVTLTVIAACLVVIAIRGTLGTTTANARAPFQAPMNVVVDGVEAFAFRYIREPLPVRAYP